MVDGVGGNLVSVRALREKASDGSNADAWGTWRVTRVWYPRRVARVWYPRRDARAKDAMVEQIGSTSRRRGTTSANVYQHAFGEGHMRGKARACTPQMRATRVVLCVVPAA